MFSDEKNTNGVGIGLIIVWIASSLFALIVILSGFEVINAGEVGIRLSMGAIKGEPITEGLYFKKPFIDTIEAMNVRTQKAEVETGAASKDLQDVKVKAAVNYQLDATKANNTWREFQNKYEDAIVVPSILESIKAATSQYTAEELITKRAEVREKIVNILGEKLSTRGIFVREVNITNFDFSQSFNEAIERKVTAEQTALAEKNRLEQVKYEAQQAVEKAKGEADARIATAEAEARAIKIQAEAITQQGGQDYVNLKAIEKWNGTLPQQMIPGATVPFINLNK